MPPVLVVTCRWKRRKPAYNGLIAHYHSGMAGSRLRSTATGSLALTLTTRCDNSGDIAGDHAPHEAGKIMPHMKQASSLATAVFATFVFLLFLRTIR